MSEAAVSFLGVIPARAGSKGIPDKNVQPIDGKPMVQYTLEAAAGSALEYAIVTSDDERVLRLAQQHARCLALPRPAELASDEASLIDVVRHAVGWWQQEHGEIPHNVVLLQPTSPLRTAADIDAAIETYRASGATSLVSVSPVIQHPAECVVVDRVTGELRVCLSADEHRRQSYAECFFIDGSIYINATARLLDGGSFFNRHSVMHVIPRSHAIDVDLPFDLEVARALVHYARTVDADVLLS